MKVFAYTMSAAGHMNSVIGLAQALQERGHQIYFAVEPAFAGQLAKFRFEEIVLQLSPPGRDNQPKENDQALNQMAENPIKFFALQLKASGILSNKTPLEKQQGDNQDKMKHMFEGMLQGCIASEPQIKEAIERIQPDLILLDHFFGSPAIITGKVPWLSVLSGNPLMLYASDKLPPFGSGLPTNDTTGWDAFRAQKNKMKAVMEEFQNRLMETFGYPPLKMEGEFGLRSPFLNVYGYPAELDYNDIVPRPSNFLQVDAFSRKIPQPFKLPAEFQAKIKPGDKLIYVSLGSMGSVDVDLMKNIVNALKDTPHKYIVSKGQLGEEYNLPENMWGENYLPQTNILPIVDLVITHGGNNTFTETFICGKPMIVMPLFGDQYDNAQRVVEKGYGARLEPYAFENKQLVETIDRLLQDDAMKQRLQQAAQRIQQNNSKEKACIVLEELVAKHAKQ